MYRIVRLFGTVLDPIQSGSQYVVMDVLPDLGDAKEFGIAGQVRLLNRQVTEVHYAGSATAKDIVHVPEQVARSVGKLPPEPPAKGRKRR